MWTNAGMHTVIQWMFEYNRIASISTWFSDSITGYEPTALAAWKGYRKSREFDMDYEILKAVYTKKLQIKRCHSDNFFANFVILNHSYLIFKLTGSMNCWIYCECKIMKNGCVALNSYQCYAAMKVIVFGKQIKTCYSIYANRHRSEAILRAAVWSVPLTHSLNNNSQFVMIVSFCVCVCFEHNYVCLVCLSNNTPKTTTFTCGRPDADALEWTLAFLSCRTNRGESTPTELLLLHSVEPL